MTRSQVQQFALLLALVVTDSTRADSGLLERPSLQVISASEECLEIEFDHAGWRSELNVQSSTGQFLPTGSPPEPSSEFEEAIPSVSRWVVVPDGMRPRLGVLEGSEEIVEWEASGQAESKPIWERLSVESDNSSYFPQQPVELSNVMVVRGVRLVRLTIYPYRYSLQARKLVQIPFLSTRVEFMPDPSCQVTAPNRRHRSHDFLQMMRGLAVNSELVGRDDPDADALPAFSGHYLIVTHEACLTYARPFIEFRRRQGYRVDILSLSAGAASSPGTIKREIQRRYDAYLDRGEDPFDHILLIGDRTEYRGNGERGQWILEAPMGNTLTNAQAAHSDYEYACLEGGENDRYPDVAISRWASGSEQQMGLAVGRSLAYSESPPINNPAWFGKAALFGQHWGNGPESAWHITIHTTIRWGEEAIRQKGFGDIRLYENYEYDPRAERIHPFMVEQFNEGVNLLFGRAELYNWSNAFVGVNDNTAFPMMINLSGHGEWSTLNMWRGGSANHLRGPVAVTCCYAVPPTAPMNYVWLKLVKGVVQEGLTFGWARNAAIIDIERVFPDYEVRIQPMYLHIKTDVDFYGDPALKPWLKTPVQARLECPEDLTPDRAILEITVRDRSDGRPFVDIPVCLYAPGSIPANPAEYARYEGVRQWMTRTDNDGVALFRLSENEQFEAGDTLYVTASAEDVVSCTDTLFVREAESGIELAEVELVEQGGNGDGDVNPGEEFSLRVSALNRGNEPLNGVRATASSDSPWLTVTNDTIEFDRLTPGEAGFAEAGFALEFSSSTPDGAAHPNRAPIFRFKFFAGDAVVGEGAISLSPLSPNFLLDGIEGGDIITLNARDLFLQVRNDGRLNAPASRLHLRSLSPAIRIESGDCTLPQVPTGDTRRTTGEALRIIATDKAAPGGEYLLEITIETEDGFRDTLGFSLRLNAPAAGDPTGPDRYGYVCFDDTDEDWENHPDYAWIEINPEDNDAQFEGIPIRFSGQSPFDIGEIQTVELPFDTQFYGVLFNSVSICTHGYIAMGEQRDILNPQNWPMDEAIGGGVGMIAPYWDRLDFDQDTRVLYYADLETGRFIIEWYQIHPSTDRNRDFSFQVILHDRRLHPTATGDSPVIIQYRQIVHIANIDDAEWVDDIPFASVGISSPDGLSGLNYTFKGVYPESSAQLANRRALLFTTGVAQTKFGSLSGSTVSARTGMAIDSALITTTYGISQTSDSLGQFLFPRILADTPIRLQIRRRGYNTLIFDDIVIPEDEERNIEFELTAPEVTPSREFIAVHLNIEEMTDIPFRLSNTGDGVFEWQFEKRLPDREAYPPWALRDSIIFGQILGQSQVEGVAFDGRRFYVACANNGSPLIFIVSKEGEVVGSFAQPGDDARGSEGLDWGGGRLWGAINNRVYGLTVEGEIEVSFETPLASISGVAFDRSRNLIWICQPGSALYACDTEGDAQMEIAPLPYRIYGLAENPTARDGFDLLLLSRDQRTNRPLLIGCDPETGETKELAEINGTAGALLTGGFVTPDFDREDWELFLNWNRPDSSGGDYSTVIEIGPRDEWFTLLRDGEDTVKTGESGLIGVDESQEFAVRLDSRGLIEADYRGEFRFTDPTVEITTILPIALLVGDLTIASDPTPLQPLTPRIISAYPNPTNSSALIEFELPYRSKYELAVHDLNGRVLTLIASGEEEAGSHSLHWEASRFPTGIYFIRIKSLAGTSAMKICIIK